MLQKADPFFGWILFGEPDRCRTNGNIVPLPILPDFLVITCRRIQMGMGGLRVGEILDQSLVAIDLVPFADQVRHSFGKQPAERVLIEADRLPGPRESGQQAGGGEALNIDDLVIPGAANVSPETP